MLSKYTVPQPPKVSENDSAWTRANLQYTCEHTFSLRRRIKSNGVEYFLQQCDLCGTTGKEIPKATLAPEVRAAAALFDADMRERRWKEKSAYYHSLRETEDQTQSAVWWRWYNTYLESTVWKEKRRAVLLRAQGVCEACRNAMATEVHHLTYARVGREPLFDLVAVCKPCHDEIGKTDANLS